MENYAESLKARRAKFVAQWWEIQEFSNGAFSDHICLTCGFAYEKEPTEKHCPECLKDIPESLRHAAPDLLQALKSCVAFDGKYRGGERMGMEDYKFNRDGIRDQARKAIAKAEGK